MRETNRRYTSIQPTPSENINKSQKRTTKGTAHGEEQERMNRIPSLTKKFIPSGFVAFSTTHKPDTLSPAGISSRQTPAGEKRTTFLFFLFVLEMGPSRFQSLDKNKKRREKEGTILPTYSTPRSREEQHTRFWSFLAVCGCILFE